MYKLIIVFSILLLPIFAEGIEEKVEEELKLEEVKESKSRDYYIDGFIGVDINPSKSLSTSKLEMEESVNFGLEIYHETSEVLHLGLGAGLEAGSYIRDEIGGENFVRVPLYFTLKNYTDFDWKAKPYGKLALGTNIFINEDELKRSYFYNIGMGLEYKQVLAEILYTFEITEMDDIKGKMNGVKFKIGYSFN